MNEGSLSSSPREDYAKRHDSALVSLFVRRAEKGKYSPSSSSRCLFLPFSFLFSFPVSFFPPYGQYPIAIRRLHAALAGARKCVSPLSLRSRFCASFSCLVFDIVVNVLRLLDDKLLSRFMLLAVICIVVVARPLELMDIKREI